MLIASACIVFLEGVPTLLDGSWRFEPRAARRSLFRNLKNRVAMRPQAKAREGRFVHEGGDA